jgi:ADP-heptose:LPS heptosyltransferase
MKRFYPFRNALVRFGMGGMDAIGDLLRKVGFFGFSPGRSEGAAFRRVVMIRLDHIGDGLLTLPALMAARRVFPNAHITLVAAPWAEDLVRPLGCVDEVVTFRAPWFERKNPSKFSWAALRELTKILREGSFDLGIDFRGDLRHLVAMQRAGIPTRVGFGTTGGGFLLTEELQSDPSRHEVESDLEPLRLFESALVAPSLPAIPVSPQTEEVLDGLLRKTGMAWDQRPVVIQFAAGYPSKDWGDDRFAELLVRLAGRGQGSVLVGSLKDRERAEQLVSRVGTGVVSLCGETGLLELAALLQRSRLYIGLDSGPSHLAVAMGTPSVLLYGDVNDLKRWGPWIKGREEKVRVLRGEASCGECGLSDCPRPKHDCFEILTPSMVWEEVEKILSI